MPPSSSYPCLMPTLDDAAIEAALADLPGWERDGDAIKRRFTRRDWRDAIVRQQASIDLMAKATGRKPFPAERLFDRRFETLAADAYAQAGGGPALASR